MASSNSCHSGGSCSFFLDFDVRASANTLKWLTDASICDQKKHNLDPVMQWSPCHI